VGHSTAITCIDWFHNYKNNKEYFITCGDDKKAILWTLNESNSNFKRKWVLEHLFETHSKGMEWHTLTYLKFF